MKFTESQNKIIESLKRELSIFYVSDVSGFEKFYLIDKYLNKVETVRKDNAKKIIEFLKIPVISTKINNSITFKFYSFNTSLKNVDFNKIQIFPEKLSNRYFHNMLWVKRGEYGIKNVIINLKVIECEIDSADIFQEFSEYVTIEVLRIICDNGKGEHEVIVLDEQENYSLDYPEITNSCVIKINGKNIECSLKMYESLKMVNEKLKYFKDLKFIKSVKTLKNLN